MPISTIYIPSMLIWILIFVVLAWIAWIYVKAKPTLRKDHVSTWIVLGSGGHTTEMLKLFSVMDLSFYKPRTFIVADTDTHSTSKADAFEQRFGHSKEAKLFKIRRSREVGQSFITSFFTTLIGCWTSFHLIWHSPPDAIFINGPGTCIPVCLASRFCSLFRRDGTKIIFLESVARVRSLSLTGKLLYTTRLTDLFLVQWPELAQRYPRADYSSRLF